MISGRWFGTSRHLKSIGMRLSELLLGLMGKKNSDHIITKHFSNWPALKVIATLLYLYSLSIPTSQFFFIIMVMLRIQLAKYWKDWHLITNSHRIMWGWTSCKLVGTRLRSMEKELPGRLLLFWPLFSRKPFEPWPLGGTAHPMIAPDISFSTEGAPGILSGEYLVSCC